MSLTLGLNTALSGLLTSQRGLDVIAQNVSNVNTPGYVRKVMNQESRVLAGRGAGVQEGAISRMVNEGLLKDLRKQSTELGKLQVEQDYFPRIDDLFGNVDDNTSIAHKMESLLESFEALGADANKPASQWQTAQSAQDVTSLLGHMTDSLQSLRLQADRDMEQTVTEINQQLANINDLNQKIVKNAAVSTGVADLQDKRDAALTKLSELMDISYYSRNDGSVIVYSSSGLSLVDNTNAVLNYHARTSVDPWMSRAGGAFGQLTVNSDPTDISDQIGSGKLSAQIELRDTVIPNMQSEIDNLATKLKAVVNQVHNRGTIAPAPSSRYDGTRTFAKQGTITPTSTESLATLRAGGTSIAPAAYGSLTFGYDQNGQATITAANNGSLTFTAGTTFSVYGSDDADGNTVAGDNDGTYVVDHHYTDSFGNDVMVVRKANPLQTFKMSGTDDSAVVLFDSSGTQVARSTVRNIMGQDFQALSPSDPEMGPQPTSGPWTVGSFSKHMQSWLQSQGCTNASVGLSAEGKMVINTGSTAVSLAFRDQVNGQAGAATKDASVEFDADGDGETDEKVSGFANFFGLNDMFVNNEANKLYDSKVLDSNFRTQRPRTLRLLDSTGQIGNQINIGAGSSLDDIAKEINKQTQVSESAFQAKPSFNLTSAATIRVSNGNGSLVTATVGPGTVTMAEIAATLTANGVVGQVVQDGNYLRLRVNSTQGEPLSIGISGGTINADTDLAKQLDIRQAQRISAAVVPDGAGYRLRILNGQGQETYVASDLDKTNESLLTELGLERSSSGMAGGLTVRQDIITSPEKISRGAVQWNADTSEYYVSEGDNTTALQLATAVGTKNDMQTAGTIFAGKYTLGEYAASSISMASELASHSKDTYNYQTTLKQSLDFQYTSYSGVNLDEEVAHMVDFQQAYAASAKVITVLSEMLEKLTEMVR
ncbi:MAG: flagellar hook-associated protein FlgK [Solirubrobacterales bacterium]